MARRLPRPRTGGANAVPEIVEDFDREVYGRVPKVTPKVKWEVTSTTPGKNGDVDIITKRLDRRGGQFLLPGHLRPYRSHPGDAGERQGSGPGDHAVWRRLWTAGRAGRHTRTGRSALRTEWLCCRRPRIGRRWSCGPWRCSGNPGAGDAAPPVFLFDSQAGIIYQAPRPAARGGAPLVGAAGAAGAGRGAAAPGAGRGPAGPTWQQQVLAKGWGYASLLPASIQADNGAGLTQGIIGLVNKGQPRKVDDWGALRAWGWGASRAMDYFETDKSVDAKKIGLEGHSRYGKATIVAMADDNRFAIAFVSSSGEGGAKLHRRNWGEQVENVAAPNEYHWMAANFLKYSGPLTVNDLPVDSHELIALCAPRPVFLSAGATAGDGWVDAKGSFLAGVGAGPVYKLLGKKGWGRVSFRRSRPLMDGEVSFRQHSSGHTDGPNWSYFLDFAGKHLELPGAVKAKK